MHTTLKQKIGAIVFDVPRYVYHLYLASNLAAWIKVRNRDDNLTMCAEHDGVSCGGKWTSDLYLPKVFPAFNMPLFRAAMAYAPIKLQDLRKQDRIPDISIVIGHKGVARLPLLQQTLRSIAAQSNITLECIVVEQDTQPSIRETLPSWVKYAFIKVESHQSPYSRAKAFNVGAQQAVAQNLLFHDNDMLIPENYAAETLRHLQNGFDFTNLKRFIFYLSQQSTEALVCTGEIGSQLEIDTIVQNALGGGSIGASKQAFNKIGYFDERFSGWGGEDNEFWERAETCKVWNYANLPLIHLWHASQPEKSDYDNASTKQLYAELSRIPPAQRIQDLTQSK